MGQTVSVRSLLRMVDDSVLQALALETNVNYKSKKLSGEVVFKLLLMSLLDNTRVSLRMMEKVYSKQLFKLYSGIEKEQTISHSSLSERLTVIDYGYFKKIYDHVHGLSQAHLGQALVPYNIRQFDSTSLSLSSKLLKKGMVSGARNKTAERKNQVKFTVGLLNGLPSSIDLYNEQRHLGEDLTLGESILKAHIKDDEVAVFDRGLKKRATFKKFNDKSILFVTRIRPTKSVKVLREHGLEKGNRTATLELLSDSRVYLYHGNKTLLKEPFRLIRSCSIRSKEPLFFLTNIEDLKAEDITEIYRRRWEIEVFFKFIKQHLHFKHFLSHSENGIKVMMYMTMIVGILLLLYKKLNGMKSYKMAKYDFTEQLNMEIIREIVVICDGDPSKSDIFDSS